MACKPCTNYGKLGGWKQLGCKRYVIPCYIYIMLSGSISQYVSLLLLLYEAPILETKFPNINYVSSVHLKKKEKNKKKSN